MLSGCMEPATLSMPPDALSLVLSIPDFWLSGMTVFETLSVKDSRLRDEGSVRLSPIHFEGVQATYPWSDMLVALVYFGGLFR